MAQNGTAIPNANLDSPAAAAYRAHKAAEAAFIEGGQVMSPKVVESQPQPEVEERSITYTPTVKPAEDTNTLVVRIPKAEQTVTISVNTNKGGKVLIGLKVLYLEELENSFSLILSKDTNIKLPPLEVFQLTLQNGAVHAVSFLGGEGNIGECKYLWLIKTDISKLNE